MMNYEGVMMELRIGAGRLETDKSLFCWGLVVEWGEVRLVV